MDYEKVTFKNKLRLVVVPIKNMESATVTIWVNTGSRYETPKLSGMSHFLEHMPAKGTTKRSSAKIISEEIDSFGAEFNAGTSKDWTNYYIKTRKAKVEHAFDLLSDMVLSPLLKTEDIEREKGVIIEEMGMYEDTPMMHIGDVFDRLAFEGNPLGVDIIGSRETVKRFTRNDFIRYRKMHYGSNTILVTVSGGVRVSDMRVLTQKYLGGLTQITEKPFKKYSHIQTGPRVMLDTKKAEQAHFILGFPGFGRGDKNRFTEVVLTTILGGGMSSRLFSEVREQRGLAYSVNTSSDHFDETGYIGTYAGVDPKRIEEALKVTLSEHYALASGEKGIEAKELIKAKEYLKGHIALSLENTKSINQFVGLRELKLRKMETPQDVYAGIDAVTVKDVVALASEVFKPKLANLAIIGPYKGSSKFEKILRI